MEPCGTDLGFQCLRRSSFQRPFCGWRLAANRCPFGDHLEPANDASCSISTSGRAQNASCSFFLERFLVLVFRGSQGRSPRRVQEGLLPPIRPIHPRIPPRSHKSMGAEAGLPSRSRENAVHPSRSGCFPRVPGNALLIVGGESEVW